VKPVLALNMWFLIQFSEARFKFLLKTNDSDPGVAQRCSRHLPARGVSIPSFSVEPGWRKAMAWARSPTIGEYHPFRSRR